MSNLGIPTVNSDAVRNIDLINGLSGKLDSTVKLNQIDAPLGSVNLNN